MLETDAVTAWRVKDKISLMKNGKAVFKVDSNRNHHVQTRGEIEEVYTRR